MRGAAEALDRVDEVVAGAFADLLTLPGVRRVGLALTEGGGRRLRFTADDRDHSRSVDWCHIDAYDDVPLTAVVRSGAAVTGTPDRLDRRFTGFAERQRRQGTAALAALPLPGSAAPLGAVILFYDSPQPFDDAQLRNLRQRAAGLAEELRRAQSRTPRDVPALADQPVEPGARVADLTVEGLPRAVGTVRRWASTVLPGWDVTEDVVDDTVLCLSELVTNAVMHTGSGCEVRLLLDGGLLTATVRDRGGEHPSRDGQELPDDLLRVHGRGLQVVDALATRWSSIPDAAGTTVWFAVETVSVPAAPAAAG